MTRASTCKKKNIGYVYGMMEEVQKLRQDAAALTEKNTQLAKQLVCASVRGFVGPIV